MSPKSVPPFFKILLQIRDITDLVLCGVFFSRYVQLKSFFFDEKNISAAGKIWDTLVEKLSTIVVKY